MVQLVIVGLAALAAATGSAIAQTQTPLERGGYLVNAVMTCDNCHTPREKGALDLGLCRKRGGDHGKCFADLRIRHGQTRKAIPIPPVDEPR